jgi:hypothetical protein
MSHTTPVSGQVFTISPHPFPYSNKHFEKMYLTGNIDLELTPQGEHFHLYVSLLDIY